MQGFDWAAYDHFGLAAIVLAGTLVASWALSAFIFSEKNRAFLHSIKGVAPPFINIIGTLFALTLAFLANDPGARMTAPPMQSTGRRTA